MNNGIVKPSRLEVIYAVYANFRTENEHKASKIQDAIRRSIKRRDELLSVLNPLAFELLEKLEGTKIPTGLPKWLTVESGYCYLKQQYYVKIGHQKEEKQVTITAIITKASRVRGLSAKAKNLDNLAHAVRNCVEEAETLHSEAQEIYKFRQCPETEGVVRTLAQRLPPEALPHIEALRQMIVDAQG